MPPRVPIARLPFPFPPQRLGLLTLPLPRGGRPPSLQAALRAEMEALIRRVAELTEAIRVCAAAVPPPPATSAPSLPPVAKCHPPPNATRRRMPPAAECQGDARLALHTSCVPALGPRVRCPRGPKRCCAVPSLRGRSSPSSARPRHSVCPGRLPVNHPPPRAHASALLLLAPLHPSRHARQLRDEQIARLTAENLRLSANAMTDDVRQRLKDLEQENKDLMEELLRLRSHLKQVMTVRWSCTGFRACQHASVRMREGCAPRPLQRVLCLRGSAGAACVLRACCACITPSPAPSPLPGPPPFLHLGVCRRAGL
jgi:hypothetical protein